MDIVAEVSVKLGLALLCSGVLGIERERKNRPAGFRTYMLVCLGSTLVMMTNQYICEVYQTGDPSRLGAQVISGVGFLGAGTIVTVRHNRVKGLTTAAGLWASACTGLAIGVEFYEGAIIGTIMIFLAMVCMHSMDAHISTSANIIEVYVELQHISSLKNVTAFFKEKQVKILDVETDCCKAMGEKGMTALFTVKIPSQKIHTILMPMLSVIDGVVYAEEI